VVPRSQRAGYGSDFKKLLFAGDTLFRRSVGRTDLWGGDQATLVSSIRGKLWSLSDETLVIPGHGPLTQIGEEKEKNPYVGLQA
jgi:glyoxylase-like metal-dependent hydrolase (beta-lactamase superfamily II)